MKEKTSNKRENGYNNSYGVSVYSDRKTSVDDLSVCYTQNKFYGKKKKIPFIYEN